MSLAQLAKKFFRNNWKELVFLTLLVVLVYFNSLGNDFLSDDLPAIVNNPLINQINYFWKYPYFNLNPSLIINFLVHKIFGLKPIFFRLPNILFHLGSSFVIFTLIGLFFKPPIPFFTAGIFAVHPILTESVTWISGGPYSGATFFILLAFVFYILSLNRKKNRLFFLSFIMFCLALTYSKKVIVFPLILLTYSFSVGNLKNQWRKSLPFWIVSGLWSLLLLGLIRERISTLETGFYQAPGINNPLIQVPIAITSYLELIFWPKNLTLYHSEMIFSPAQYLLRLAIFISFLAICLYFLKKDRRIFFWLAFFLISLAPTLTPLRVAWVVAERYVYFGSLGILVIIALLIEKVGRIFKNQKISYFLWIIIIVALSLRTIARNHDWKNQDTLWLATARTSPSSPQNHNNLGDLYARRGEFIKAAEEFKRAIDFLPNYADAYHNLANTYHQLGNDDLAVKNYQKAIFFNSNLWQSHQNLAAIYFNHGKTELAKQELERAININPQNPELFLNQGTIFLKMKEMTKAKEAFLKVLQLDPQNQKAKQILINLP